MKINDTVELMLSEDYKERFRAEYYQLKIRYIGLTNMCHKWQDGKLDFEPTCSMGVYDYQRLYMKEYMEMLEYRAELEGIEL